MKYQLWQGDCFPWMQRIPRDSVDLVIADLPYGITRAAWDKIIPMPALWLALNRVKKRNAAVLLFGYGRFSAELLFSNEADYRYTIIWYKTRGTGALSVNKQPLRIHEDVLVFYRNQPIYNPQLRDGKPYIKVRDSEKETEYFDTAEKRISDHQVIKLNGKVEIVPQRKFAF